MSQFFAPEVFPATVPSPKYLLVLRAIEGGDLDGADFFLSSLLPGQKNAVLDAQLSAALSIYRGDSASAFAALQVGADGIAEPTLAAKISFQSAVLAEDLAETQKAIALYAQAARNVPSCLLFRLSYVQAVWRYDGQSQGRQVFERLLHEESDPELWAAWVRLERTVGADGFAVSVVERARKRHPDDPNLISLSAACYISLKDFRRAIQALNGLSQDNAMHPVVLCNLAAANMGLGRFKDALAYYLQAIAAAPEMYDARLGAARVGYSLRLHDIVDEHARAAIALSEKNEDALSILVQSLFHSGHPDEAIADLRQAIAQHPDSHALIYLLGVMLHETNRSEEAEEQVWRALEVKPEVDQYYDLIGSFLLQRGEFDQAEDCKAKAVAVVGELSATIHSNFLFAKHYNPKTSPEALLIAHCEYGARFGGCGDDPERPLLNTPNQDRKLRVGYISPDFRAHSVAFYMMAIVDGHNRDRFDVYLYNCGEKRDRLTEWFQDTADHWREAHGSAFHAIHQMILDDEIDILVDLTGHTGNNMLPVFARRAAPVQVTYLGYPNTTGVPAMDYRIVDAVTDPYEGADAHASETLVRLADSFLCYRMIPDTPEPPVGPEARGLPITFGSFNNVMKFNDRVFDTWSEVLRQVPESRLMLKSKFLASQKTHDWIVGAFEKRGVTQDRLDIRMHVPTLAAHLDLYGQMDLALDTFPYNGTTTTCEAISMGVPVLTLSGDRHCARVGHSIMATLGLEGEFVAQSEEEFVSKAVAFARNRQRLTAFRQDMRPRLLSSPLCDEAGFLGKLEAAYVSMWHDWCARSDRRFTLLPSKFEMELLAKCAKS